MDVLTLHLKHKTLFKICSPFNVFANSLDRCFERTKRKTSAKHCCECSAQNFHICDRPTM